MTAPMSPYSTLNLFSDPTKLPSWVPDELEQQRIMSYQIYEQIYWNVPETYKIVFRGEEDKPIYLPTARTIIEATNRYIAPDFGFTITPRADVAATMNPEMIAQAQEAFDDLFTRERFWSKFAGNKRYGLIRGDWLWHIVADPAKPEGSRISIYPLDPGSYFPVWDPNDLDRVLGCHIVDTFLDEESNETYIKRLTYRKSETPGGPITVEEAIFETDDWNGPTSKPVRVTRPLGPVPGITSIPVYHIKNFEEPANPFGSSELRGIERILGAINQSVSDEELALALDGIGLYGTDAPPPTNADGEEIDWVLGPGRVVEFPQGHKFERISGVGSVTPFQDHIGLLKRELFNATGVSDAAMGIVDVSVAQSGISLQLQFQPMVAKTNEKDQEVLSVHAQMFHDLATQWFPTYERLSFDGLKIMPRIGGKIPVDRVARLTELNDMIDRKVISSEYYRSEAAKLGYVFPENIKDQIADEASAAAQAALAADPLTAQFNNETSGGVSNDDAESGSTTAE